MAVTVIALVTRSPSQQGLLALPALVGQLSQIFLGSFLVGAFKAIVRAEREQAEEGPAGPEAADGPAL